MILRNPKKHILFKIFGLSLLLAMGVQCANPSSQDRMRAIRDSSREKPAAIGMESFWLDHRSPPDRQVHPWEYYYKHCTLVGRQPEIDWADYSCTDPY